MAGRARTRPRQAAPVEDAAAVREREMVELRSLIERAKALQKAEADAGRQYKKLRPTIAALLAKNVKLEEQVASPSGAYAYLEETIEKKIDARKLFDLISPELFWTLVKVNMTDAENALDKSVLVQVRSESVKPEPTLQVKAPKGWEPPAHLRGARLFEEPVAEAATA